MVAINNLSDGLEARLATITGLHPSSEWKENVETPGALIFPPAVVFDTFDGVYTVTFRILVFVNISAGMGQAARSLNSYMDTSGSTSITAAIAADRTLGSAADDVEITAMRWTGERAGFVEMGNVTYWGAYLENIPVYVSD